MGILDLRDEAELVAEFVLVPSCVSLVPGFGGVASTVLCGSGVRTESSCGMWWLLSPAGMGELTGVASLLS